MDSPPAGPFFPHVAAISLAVRDVQASVAFYAALGLAADVRSDLQTAVYQLNGVLLYLVRKGIMPPEMGPGAPGQGLMSIRHDVQEDRHMEEILAQVTRAGGRVIRMPERTLGGGRRAWFADLDGHRWELAWEPHNRRDGHGGVWLTSRERAAEVPDFPDDPDTEDLGPALVTEEAAREPSAARSPHGLATPVMVEFEEAAASGPPRDPQPAGRPRPMLRPRPRPDETADRRAEVPSPATATEPRRGGLSRAVGWLVLVGAPLLGAAVAWMLLRKLLP